MLETGGGNEWPSTHDVFAMLGALGRVSLCSVSRAGSTRGPPPGSFAGTHRGLRPLNPLFVRIWLDATPHRVQPRHCRATREGGSAWTTRRR